MPKSPYKHYQASQIRTDIMVKRKPKRKDATAFPDPIPVKDRKSCWRINELSRDGFKKLAERLTLFTRIQFATFGRSKNSG